MSTIGTLKYRRYAAKSPQDPDAPAKWYARAVQEYLVAGYLTDGDYAAALTSINRMHKPGDKVRTAR